MVTKNNDAAIRNKQHNANKERDVKEKGWKNGI
jgi:hypothetical protein